jgi:hypothetical protein
VNDRAEEQAKEVEHFILDVLAKAPADKRDGIIRAWNAHVNAFTDKVFFDRLKASAPEMFNINGRPNWIESQKVTGQDEALLKEFEETLNRNIAANGGRKHRASQQTYADLADKYDAKDEYTVKQRVMRARRRQKALKQATQDILRIAARGETDGDNVVTPKEYKRRGENLLEAFRQILRTK